MLSEKRQAEIIDLLNTNGEVTVSNLDKLFDVSAMTIRRDLDDLASKGLLQRVHGGAISTRGRSFEPAFLSRSTKKLPEKQRIASTAINLIQNGDSIALDVGTTTLEIARQLKEHHDLTIITPSIRIANILAEYPGSRIVVTGGILREGEMSLVGRLAELAFQHFFVDKLFLGIGGISVNAGLTEYNLEDSIVKKAMIQSAKEIIIVADAEKFGRTTFASVAPLDIASHFITDQGVDPNIVAKIRKKNIKVTIV